MNIEFKCPGARETTQRPDPHIHALCVGSEEAHTSLYR
jgi:hypothetical protein